MRPAALCLLLMTGLPAWPAAAQTSRAEVIAAEQAEKSRTLVPNTPGKAEKVLEWLEGHANDPTTWYVTFGGLYPSGGLAPGLGLRHAFGGARLDTGVAYSLRNYKLARVALGLPELAGNRLSIETHARWTDATQVPFYGLGNDASDEARVNYGLRAAEAGIRVAVRPVSWYRLGGGVSVRQMEDRGGTGRHPSIATLPSADVPPGRGSDIRYTQLTASTAIDWRESPGYTRSGGLYAIALSDLRDADDRFGFRKVTAEVQQFLPILKEHWVLGFRGLVETTDVDDGQAVPYYLLPALGGARRHRGFGDFRFQDRHILLLSGEYRWLPSRVLDMALFVDAGKAARDRRDLDVDGLKTAYGIGMRIHGPTFTPLRLDVARSREGIRIHLTGGVAF